jgi:hypothetical protein
LRPGIVAAICLLVFGCGYSHATSRLTDDYRTIAVPAFKNESFEPDIQIRVTNLLIRELNADGRLRVVDEPAAADLVLRGVITDFEAHAVSYSARDNIGQFRIVVHANAMLENTHTGAVLCQKKELTGTDFYQVQGGRTREEALEGVSEELVETLVYECLDNYW